MNTSTKVRVAIFSLLSGSALLLGPVAPGAQAATGGEQPGPEIAKTDVADKPPRLGDAYAASRLGDDAPALGFRGSIRLSPQATTS